MNAIQVLSLRNNQITGQVPFFPNSVFLDLAFNNLTGTSPTPPQPSHHSDLSSLGSLAAWTDKLPDLTFASIEGICYSPLS